MCMRNALSIVLVVLLAYLVTGCTFSSLIKAAEKGNLSRVKSILESEPNLVNSSVADHASFRSAFTLDYKSEANSGWRVLGLPVSISISKDPTCFGWTPLHAAAYGGNKEVVEFLINKGASINAKECDVGATPLLYAVVKGYKDVAELLIANGADINAKEISGATPLFHAASKDVADLLITNGADLNTKSNPCFVLDGLAGNEGNTIYWANGTSIQKTVGGRTALHTALENGRKDIAEYLIAKGAEINTRDYNGETPLDLAIRIGIKDMADLLREHGAF